jgi:hypothetical protein
MHVRQERVSAIERAKVDVSELRTLSAYIRALGGRMEVIADFGGERLVVGGHRSINEMILAHPPEGKYGEPRTAAGL